MFKLLKEGVPASVDPSPNRFQGVSHIWLPAVPGKRPDRVRVPVNDDMISNSVSKKFPNVPTIPEMKTGLLEELNSSVAGKKHLACKLELHVNEQNDEIRNKVRKKKQKKGTPYRGQTAKEIQMKLGWGSWMLWTPPYTPVLQPIEEFWGGGKNYVAEQYEPGRTMKEVIEQLHDGWYGNPDVEHSQYERHEGGAKQAIDCERLVRHAMGHGNRFIKAIGGLTGSMETGVQVVEGAEVLALDGETDMYVKEMADGFTLRADVGEDEPLTLDEDEHLADQLKQVADEGAEIEDDEEAAAARLPPDSPAKGVKKRPRRGKGK